MNATCLRCDWQGETDSKACPECGAPLYRLRQPEQKPAPTGAPSPGTAVGPDTGRAVPPDEDRPPSEPRRVGTSPRSVFALVAAVFAVVLFVVTRGGSAVGPERPPARSDTASTPTGGILVYAVADGHGAARLWLWDVGTDRFRKGPLVREPSDIVNVATPAYGWLGLTAPLGEGVQEASVLGSLAPDARPRPLGRGDIVTWAGRGDSVVLVDRGPLLDNCRRSVSITSVRMRGERQTILDRTMCGDVLSAGRTTIGYFLTVDGPFGTDVVGAGYPGAGLLLADHGVIGIGPDGAMLVTPSSEFVPAVVATRPAHGDFDPPPLRITGSASLLRQFRGRPAPLLVRGVALRVDHVLAWAPAGDRALVVAELGGDRPGLWSVPLVTPEREPAAPRYLADVRGATAAAYASDDSAFVVTDARLWSFRHGSLTPVDVPPGAPAPTGALAWIAREPVTGL